MARAASTPADRRDRPDGERPFASSRSGPEHASIATADSVALLPLVSRWWWALALGMLVAGAVGYLVVSKVPKTYEAEAALLVGPVNTDVSLDASGALASTYADLATSQKALLAAIAATGAKLTPLKLEEAVSAIPNQVTRIVSIKVSDRDPVLAAGLANALTRHVQLISAEVEPATGSVLQRFAGEPEIQRLDERTQARVVNAGRRLFGPSTAGLVTIIDPASPPPSAVRPVVPLTVLMAALGGLVIAGILVLFRESRTGRRARGS